MSSGMWKVGDRVRHVGRPEWGPGLITSVERATQDGKPCQRVFIRFERVGSKTLSTAFAELRDAAEGDVLTAQTSEDADPLLINADKAQTESVMTALPDPATDPFRPLKGRLVATLALYTYDGSGRSLIDWAVAQSGLADPLSRFNRHELEAFFQKFKADMDSHLKKLLLEATRQDPGLVAEVSQGATGAAAEMIRRFGPRR